MASNKCVKLPEGLLCLQVTLAGNFFGGFYLTHLLLDVMRSSAPARLVYTTSISEVHAKFITLSLGSWHGIAGGHCMSAAMYIVLHTPHIFILWLV